MSAGTALPMEADRAADPTRTIFFGSGTFAVAILDALATAPRVRVVAVVTAPDRPAGRAHALTPTPVATRARSLGLRVLQPARVRAPEVLADLATLRPDLGVLADYGQIVPPALLDLPVHGILNVHPSLLPRHRGATPIPAAIAAGDAEAGVSIFRMDEGIDTGPVVAARSWPLRGDARAPELELEASRQGATLLLETVDGWLDGTLPARPQAEAGATVTRPFRREDGRLDPARPASELERQIRANEPWPGAFIDTEVGRVGVLAASVAAHGEGDEAGRLVEHDGHIALATSAGRLVLDEVVREGRRAASGADFLRGQRQLVGSSVRARDAAAASAPVAAASR
jgi:methionyl-tRNA formyltransferase